MTAQKRWKWGALALGTVLTAGLLSACNGAGASDKPNQQNQQPTDPTGNEEATNTTSPFMEDSLQATIESKDGKDVVTNETSMKVVVNKHRFLPDGYEPPDLVVPDVPFSFGDAQSQEKSHLRKEAAGALEQLFAGAKSANIELYAVSGYRSYARQKNIYDYNVSTKGEEETAKVSAFPGTSEHQTGLAMDVSALSVNNDLEQTFGDTEEGRWLAQHAHEYGFIIHYLKGKEEQTGYSYEPWHIRYVGTDLAQAVYDSGLSLEEYLDESNLKK
ncbi:D-alanyl-D-alanine carboxypeptidase family protein [Saccharibacillus sp. JS10]|uniref:M15 family metallopeptidase n=1 Tax=Saccharibacillus sp. JS10 TaxID=2950552 RepID=UPI00210E1B83|nr:M15 family metallopeptidase [Saccharibacillus sp. JS10]MCQ4087367.1 M15 family metallopeptidase [Saccharibacillus sp. JS10]